MKFFDHDAPFFRVLSLLADVTAISLLWLLTSIPIVTIGATTSSAFYVITRRISNMEYQIFTDYFTAFKRNFFKSTIIFLIIALFSLFNFFNMFGIAIPGTMGTVLFVLQVFLAFELLFVFIHVFPLTARFDMNAKQLIKSAMVMANKHFLYTLAHVVVLAALAFLTFLQPVILFFGFGIYCLASSFLMIRLWRKYRPEMDKNIDLEEEKKSDEETE